MSGPTHCSTIVLQEAGDHEAGGAVSTFLPVRIVLDSSDIATVVFCMALLSIIPFFYHELLSNICVSMPNRASCQFKLPLIRAKPLVPIRFGPQLHVLVHCAHAKRNNTPTKTRDCNMWFTRATVTRCKKHEVICCSHPFTIGHSGFVPYLTCGIQLGRDASVQVLVHVLLHVLLFCEIPFVNRLKYKALYQK